MPGAILFEPPQIAMPQALSAPEGDKPLASPAVRLRAREAGIDLRQVPGTGPAGRITHEDLDAFIARGPGTAQSARRSAPDRRRGHQGGRPAAQDRREDVGRPRHIPHITYVEEVDVTALEELAGDAQQAKAAGPAEADAPALPDARHGAGHRRAAESECAVRRRGGVVHQHAGVHIGIAAQTLRGPDGAGGPARRSARPLGLRGGS